MLFFVFSVSSLGLYGSTFSAGYVVIDETGKELAHKRLTCSQDLPELHGSDEGRGWSKRFVPVIKITHRDIKQMRGEFWGEMLYWGSQGAMLLMKNFFPTGAIFLLDYIADSEGKLAPHKIHELNTYLTAARIDLADSPARLATELPTHDVVSDARYHARQLQEAIKKIDITHISVLPTP